METLRLVVPGVGEVFSARLSRRCGRIPRRQIGDGRQAFNPASSQGPWDWRCTVHRLLKLKIRGVVTCIQQTIQREEEYLGLFIFYVLIDLAICFLSQRSIRRCRACFYYITAITSPPSPSSSRPAAW